MKRWTVILVAIAQLAVLLVMAGEREWIARAGTPIVLRTAPIDPRDPMRGDYVRLEYEISMVPRALCSDRLESWFEDGARVRDRKVYAALRVADDGLAELAGLSDEPPDDGLFLRGRAEHVSFDNLRVRYGVEAFFMQQGRARALEDEMRGARRGSLLNMTARVNSRGAVVLQDYEWEPLGITLRFERAAERPDDPRRWRELIAIDIELKNHGDAPIAIVDRPRAGSFRLARNLRRHSQAFSWVGEGDPMPAAKPEDVRLIAPGETHVTRIDLADPRWFVIPEDDGEPVSLSSLRDAWDVSLRFEYTPPAPGEIVRLPHAEMMQHRVLRSAAFSPAGGVD
ncbi:MAG: GDYXXLXY domain-containing protein [Opitutaceae bacterium]